MKIYPPRDGSKYIIKSWTENVLVDDRAIEQLHNIATLPFIYKHIAVMPDVHWGKGATIGSVIPTRKAIIPAAVGVDIGCGMLAAQITLKASELPDNLQTIRFAIEKAVPHGRTDEGGANDRGAWGETHPYIENGSYMKRQWEDHLSIQLQWILDQYPELGNRWNIKRALRHLGTLGTGNHFIELCLDENQNVWIMLHSGSRGIGNAIGTYFIELAKKDMKRWFINLPDEDLSYFPEGSEHFQNYWGAVKWAQEYAHFNRQLILSAIVIQLETIFRQAIYIENSVINCHHNYVDIENHFGENVYITRKGAVRAREGDLGIIPGSMGAKSFIVRGKGNPQSFHSCSHGAGRAMSRNEAKKLISIEQHIRDTEGVECRKDESVLDETPSAYKDIDLVMSAQQELVDIVRTLKQVLCVKG